MRALLPWILCAAACASQPTPPPAAPPTASATLPPIELRTLDGRAARLDEVTRGRPALVVLWATWCDACARELGALTRLDEQARKSGAAVVAVDVGEPAAQVAAFVQRRGLPYAQLVDERFVLADALGQTRVPATLVLDRAGRIVYRGGAFDEAALAALRAALTDGGGDDGVIASTLRTPAAAR